ncbi:hypothetical protein HUJ05_010198 [Dendroctonus ponderosae]|nr:hypothetical protein HUJ05_010198 [Dendroctonus ponderosae]
MKIQTNRDFSLGNGGGIGTAWHSNTVLSKTAHRKIVIAGLKSTISGFELLQPILAGDVSDTVSKKIRKYIRGVKGILLSAIRKSHSLKIRHYDLTSINYSNSYKYLKTFGLKKKIVKTYDPYFGILNNLNKKILKTNRQDNTRQIIKLLVSAKLPSFFIEPFGHHIEKKPPFGTPFP